MNTKKTLLWTGIAAAIGTLIYQAIRNTESSVRTEPVRKNKNRHLNPVFSKLKDLQSMPEDE